MTEILQQYDVAIVGGGLAGLAASIELAREGFRVILLEKKHYPFHRVCGEYISEDSRPFLERLGIPVSQLGLPDIRTLVVSAPGGEKLQTSLDSGGFGISRYMLDNLLANQARAAGVELLEGVMVRDIIPEGDRSRIIADEIKVEARLVIGSFGKRSNLDIRWKRKFATEKTGRLQQFVAVKYHIRYPHDNSTIALHNFRDGYCGISAIEDGISCLCYLTTAANLAASGNSIPVMEASVLAQNPHLEKIFREAERLWAEPLSISQVSFAGKSLIENHVLMVGDAAGMITPLCGNGMSMALQGSKILTLEAGRFLRGDQSREELEKKYQQLWKYHFGRRLLAGRMIQGMFGDPGLTTWLVKTGRVFPGFARYLVRQTHGSPF